MYLESGSHLHSHSCCRYCCFLRSRTDERSLRTFYLRMKLPLGLHEAMTGLLLESCLQTLAAVGTCPFSAALHLSFLHPWPFPSSERKLTSQPSLQQSRLDLTARIFPLGCAVRASRGTVERFALALRTALCRTRMPFVGGGRQK